MGSTAETHNTSPSDSREPVSREDVLTRLRAELPHLQQRWKVNRLGVFGSYARGDETDGSDLDLLVTFSEKPDLFEYVALERYLEDALGLSVDVGMPSELRSSIRARVEEEVEYL